MASLPVSKIHERIDARSVDLDAVMSLADSICEVGLINPIRVRPRGDEWEVIAGVHRLQACASLGLVEIECVIVDDNDLQAELAMIDENLCRAELSPSDRARQTARRKAIYLELHPETGHGSPGVSRQVGDTQDRADAERFTAETAKVTGQSERAVQRNAERGEKVIAEVMDLIRGTKLDTGAYLDKLKKMPPNDQFKAAQRDLLNLRHQQRASAKRADAPMDDDAACERQVAALMAAWNKAGPDARAEFRDRIDVPVFDSSRAA